MLKNKKIIIGTILIVTAILTIAGIIFVKLTYRIDDDNIFNPKSVIPLEWRSCEKNTDCIETSPTCCDCSGGGEETAINKQFFEKWQSGLKKDCICPGVVTCHPGYPICQNKICEYKQVSENECIKEGNEYPLDGQPYACCEELNPISCATPSDNQECSDNCQKKMYCTSCGNGRCEKPENICNCPADCLSKIAECYGLQDKVREECECTAQGGWWDNQCYPLTTDFNKSCTNGTQCQGICLGENWQSISGYCSKWTEEKDCHYVLINGKVNFAIGCN